MRIVHVAPTALSNISAAWRIKLAQREFGLDAVAAVQIGLRSDNIFTFDKSLSNAIRKKRFFERVDSIPVRLSPNRDKDLPWSTGWSGRKVSQVINSLEPDVVNFHWLTNGSVNLNDLRNLKCPIVFTLHDVWALTGGCHCNLECDGWRRGCSDCPQLGKSLIGLNFAKILRSYKVSAYAQIPRLSIVTPSRWLAKMAIESGCFNGRSISVIPNCLNLDIFHPGDKKYERKKLNLPQDKIIIGFGAVNATSVSYKGYDLFIEAMQVLRNRAENNIHIVIFGSKNSTFQLPFESTFLGSFEREEDLASIYNACDVFVSPSRQDNFPSTVVESTASGTPVVAFDVGGVSDIVEHEISGYLAKPFDVVDLAYGIQWLIDSPDILLSAGIAASKFTSLYCAPNVVAKKYLDLYSSLIES